MRNSKLPLLLLLLSLAAGSARAEEEEEEEEPTHPFRHSVSLDALSFLGGYGFHGETLLGTRHGLLVDALYGLYGPGTGTWKIGAGYRYHFRPGLEGLFAGIHAAYGGLDVETYLQQDEKLKSFQVESPLAVAGAHLGYRWLWGNGVTITLRGGYGFPLVSDFEWTPEPEEQSMKSFVETMFGLDAESSIGYSF